MIGALSEVCAGLPDQRKGPRRDGDYTMADIGLAAFSIFFMGSPSFLGHQRALAEGHGRSNCETLFGMAAIPSDNYIRLMLDGASPAAFDGLFMKAIEAVRWTRSAGHEPGCPKRESRLISHSLPIRGTKYNLSIDPILHGSTPFSTPCARACGQRRSHSKRRRCPQARGLRHRKPHAASGSPAPGAAAPRCRTAASRRCLGAPPQPSHRL